MKQKYLLLPFLFAPLFSLSQLLTPLVDSVPLDDGKKLAADIHIPSGSGPWPVILIQTPYNRQAFRFGLPLGVGIDIASSDYVFVVTDWRGFYGSAGAAAAGADRGMDGANTVEWITAQSWSNGLVGTWGPSALGRIQYMTAKYNPPGLICAVPLVAGIQTRYEDYYPGGDLRKEYLDQLDALGFGTSPLVLAHPTEDIYWSVAEMTTQYYDSIRVPMFMIGGWYDHNIEVMLQDFAELRSSSDPTVQDKHRLLMGPWAHGGHGSASVGTSMQGQLDYPAAAGWSDSLAVMFLDYHLRGIANGWDATPYVTYFQMGEDAWHNEPSWPPASTTASLYLQSSGELTNDPPASASGESVRNYDPRDPSPTVGGSTLRLDLDQGPYDQAPVVESRGDIMIFTTPVLTTDMEVKGAPSAELFVSSDRTDTDVCVRLTDVYPDGRSMIVQDGVRRMRFRSGFSAETLMTPGTIYTATVEMPNTAITFPAGHSIRLDVTFSNYPRFDANDNSGGTMYVPGDTFIAANHVYHNSVSASRLILPLTSPLSVTDKTGAANLSVWPSPANDNLFLSLEGLAPEHIRCVNLLGQEMPLRVMQANGSSIRLDVSGLASGVYGMVVETPKGTLTKKWVKGE